MMTRRRFLGAAAVCAASTPLLHAADQPPERTRLYTTPDAANTGGLKGHISAPSEPLEQILAIPTQATPEDVYQGEISGAKRDAFVFKNLPPGKYDLVAIFPQAVYEGTQLSKEENTLTAEDRKKVEETIHKSEAFYTKKFIHRLEGETGRGNFCRCFCTFFRDQKSNLLLETFNGASERPDFRRTFKLVVLKDVGPGWQIVRSRDLYPIWSDPKRALPVYHHAPSLGQIRVADEVKDLGALDVTK